MAQIKSGMALKWGVFIFATGLAIFTVFFLPLLERKIPSVPDDSIHTKVSVIEECIDCHGRGKRYPLPDSHKAVAGCIYCHRLDE